MPKHVIRGGALAFASGAALLLSGCATMGSLMSPYSEKFSCKNDDHGQCIHPERPMRTRSPGSRPKSDPAVTNDSKMLRDGNRSAVVRSSGRTSGAFGTLSRQRLSELKGLIEQPVTPMLKPPRTVRTLILPYADRQRPDRLYMPRYVYSLMERPQWVVGRLSCRAGFAEPGAPTSLEQVRTVPTMTEPVTAR
jgi:conjugal transfer pilus assembly protein TraV